MKTQVTFLPWRLTAGFVSESANLLLLRVMAWRRRVPSDARFLALDTEGKLCYSTYVRGLPGRAVAWGQSRRGMEDAEEGEETVVVGKRGWDGDKTGAKEWDFQRQEKVRGICSRDQVWGRGRE